MDANLISLREATAGDLPFLAALYCDVRRREVDAWGWPQQQRDMFLNLQFRAQSQSYQAMFPAATNSILCLGETPIGRLLVDRQAKAIHLVDVALLEEYRGRGIGSGLLRELIAECDAARIPLRLHVLNGNPAIELYRRLGFAATGGDALYLEMQYSQAVREGEDEHAALDLQ